jgi:hypothetical protein
VRVLAVDVSKGARDYLAACLLQSGHDHTVKTLARIKPADLHGALSWTVDLLEAHRPEFWCFDASGPVGHEFWKLVQGSPAIAVPWFPVVTSFTSRSPRQDPTDRAIVVSKADLVAAFFVKLKSGQFHCPPAVPLAILLRREIATFETWTAPNGLTMFGAKRGFHDDLLSAAMMAVFVSDNLAKQGEINRWRPINGDVSTLRRTGPCQ